MSGIRAWLAKLLSGAGAAVVPPPTDLLGGQAPPEAASRPAGIVFTPELIRRGFPGCADPAAWAVAFTAASARFPDISPLGWACILAKAATEARGLVRWDEDLYYTTVAQVVLMHGDRALTTDAARAARPAYVAAINAARAAKRVDPVPPAPILADVEPLLRNPKALGDRAYSVWGGYDARGLGVNQLTTLRNHEAFASTMGMTLAAARAYMQTIPGAAMTAPWYLTHFGAVAAANRGDMLRVMAVVAGKTDQGLRDIWGRIHGDQQMADFARFRALLAA